MGRKEDFINVMSGKMPEFVPLWELHFHLWANLSKGEFVSGRLFDALSESKKHTAIKRDAQIIVEIGERLGFGAVSIPDPPWDCIYTLPKEWRLELIRQIKKMNPDFCVLASCGGVISMPSSSDDYLNFSYKLFDEPEEIDCYCESIYQGFLIDSGNLLDAGIDGLYIAADIADNRTPFLNREQLNRWYFPYLQKSVEHLKKMGLYAILHCDGNISTLLEDIKESGIDAYQAVDPVAGMDILEVKRIFDGKVVVCGNFDCGLMLTGTTEEVYQNAADIVKKCKQDGAFVFGNSNAVDVRTPLDNYNAFLLAWRENGKY